VNIVDVFQDLDRKDDVVVVGIVVEAPEPGLVWRARVGQRCQPDEKGR